MHSLWLSRLFLRPCSDKSFSAEWGFYTASLAGNMYSAPGHFPIPPEVTSFQSDAEKLGMICDLNHWYITPEWASRFQRHLATLLPIATEGNPWAQYFVATLYMNGYIYATESDAIANHHSDSIELSGWLERCARQGFVAAVDNLITNGVGHEAERLRVIFREVESQSTIPTEEHGLPVYPPSICEEVWRRAYGAAG